MTPTASPALRARAGEENFPVALRLLPARHRQGLMALYSFARTVDDLGDEPGVTDRLEALDRVRADLVALPSGGAQLDYVRPLAPLVRAGAPVQLFLDLVEANRVDQTTTRYQSWDQLLGYCRLSANPVGRLVLYQFGRASAERFADSDAVCTALQVLEHLQDLREDLERGRVYLPQEDLATFGVRESDLGAARASAGLRALTAELTRRCRDLLTHAGPLTASLSGAPRLAVAGFAGGGQAVAAALRAAHFDTLAAPVRPSRSTTALRAGALFLGRGASR